METFKPLKKLFLSPKLPGDKSISHRSLIFAGLAKGKSCFQNLSLAEDVLSTKKVLSLLGTEFVETVDGLQVFGVNKKFKNPTQALDCANAGTLMRLMMGALSGQEFSSTLIGDESLSARPMGRVRDVLEKFGAHVLLRANNFAPLTIEPSRIDGAQVTLETASAQVKSAALLAGLFARSRDTVLRGKIHSRDHTERLLKYFGVEIEVQNDFIFLRANQNLKAIEYFVPNDISAASFWIAASLLCEESEVVLENVGLNPTRMGFVRVLERACANIETILLREDPEPIGVLRVKSSELKSFEVSAEEIPSLIDEIPLLALIATQAHGVSKIYGAGELKFKESNRLETTRAALEALGAKIEIYDNDIVISGKQKLHGGFVKTKKDHRISMMGAIARFCCNDEIQIEEIESAKISDPYFFEQMRMI